MSEDPDTPASSTPITRRRLLGVAALALGAGAFAGAIAANDAELTEATELP
ncbi:hypothetical protein SAMN05428985_104364 [Nocardioides sp. YR527]|uniref:hypothetical protein n=1 Tax=Nocardioides sp. YR527 TaxID=1881028 RepID=UPI00088A05ED|nr:hypothetical protein [Nocardioides sp. YR527]SDK52565.1 hypothetical protein SAMN05428985_104364 [Nocardioides sp. YR527]